MFCRYAINININIIMYLVLLLFHLLSWFPKIWDAVTCKSMHVMKKRTTAAPGGKNDHVCQKLEKMLWVVTRYINILGSGLIGEQCMPLHM